MLHSILLVVVVVVFLTIFEVARAKSNEKKGKPGLCEKRCHASFTPEQKKQLCSGAMVESGGSVIGPAICGAEAKDVLRMKFEDILDLCMNATSASPVACFKGLDYKARASYGIDLCRGATTALPVDCYKQLSAFRGSNVVKSEKIFEFCNGVDDKAPLQCIESVGKNSIMAINPALDICKKATNHVEQLPTWSRRFWSLLGFSDETGVAISHCIKEIKRHINPAQGLTSTDALNFCVEVNIGTHDKSLMIHADKSKSPPVECFAASKSIKTPSGASSITVQQRLSLCMNAAVALGPVNCTSNGLLRIPKGEPMVKLHTDDYLKLCEGAVSTGPSDCFAETRSLGSVEDRFALCIGAVDTGPSKCYRRAEGAFAKNFRLNQIQLCLNAASEEPALCAAAAPNYLSPAEKVDLCTMTPNNRFDDPSLCLQAIPSSAKLFQNAPKKGLGYSIENILLQVERTSRKLLVEMCSFTYSQDPMASAVCFKNSPKTLNHDDVAKMCTNISSSEMAQHIQHCHRSLPRGWRSEDATVLCEDTTSQAHSAEVVKCATYLSRQKGAMELSASHIASLCKSERLEGSPVQGCVKEVLDKHSTIMTSSGAYLLSGPDVIFDVCSGARSSAPGKCLVKLASYPSSRISFDPVVPPLLCRQGALPGNKDPMTVLPCLEATNARVVTSQEVTECATEKDFARYLKLVKVESEDYDPRVTAGKRFSIWFEVQNQWHIRYVDNPRSPVYSFSASINGNNPQGAILWGQRSNYSAAGILQLNSLVISQAGEVSFKLSSTMEGSEKTTMDIFHLNVIEDPVNVQMAPCLYVFKEAFCPSGLSTDDWEAEFPNIKSYAPSKRYLQNIQCQNVLSTWHVDSHINADGSMWVQYRLGVDAIWTGLGLPLMEMTPAEKLGLEAPRSKGDDVVSAKDKKTFAKAVRRAYYRKSLQWHPDRWVGMSTYSVAVKGAFELVNEAYQIITANKNAEKVGKNSEYE